MSVTVIKGSFESVKRKVNARANATTESVLNAIAKKVAERGCEILQAKYAGAEAPIDVYCTAPENGRCYIVAHGDQVAYVEFGTGETGEGTYKGSLPQSGVPITGAWVYNYPSPFKVTHETTGETGWYYGGFFTTGWVAGNQIYETARELESEIPNILKE